MNWSSNNMIVQNAITSGYGSSAVNQVVMSNIGNSIAIANGNNNNITMANNNMIVQNAIASGYGSSAVNQVVMSNIGNSTVISNGNNNSYGYTHNTRPRGEAYIDAYSGTNNQETLPQGGDTHNHFYGDTIIGDGNIQGDNNNVGNGNDFSTNMWGRETFRFTDEADSLTIQGDGKDRITNFDAEADTIYLDADELMDGNLSDGTIYIAQTRRDVRWYSQRSHELIYFEPKGKLLYDGNGSQRGLGDGGEITKLTGSPELYSDSVQLV